MTLRANAKTVALLCACTTLALPAMATAASGGSGPSGGGSAGNGSGGSSGGTGFQPGSNPLAQPGNVTVTASGGGVTIATRASAFLEHQLRVTGSVSSSLAGDVVVIQRSGHETGWKWAPTARTRVLSNGSFSATWDTNHIGRFAVRAVVEQSGGGAANAWPTVTVTVYRQSIATLYGPGFWGSQTACGEILHKQTIGVANRTLPCGTQVALYYGGRTIVVPVIDRGPYANGADWDLTMATGQALGMSETETIGAVSLPRPH